MATDAQVMTLVGTPWPPHAPMRCGYCNRLGMKPPIIVVGCWHPHGTGAYVVVACPTCKSTGNGGAP